MSFPLSVTKLVQLLKNRMQKACRGDHIASHSKSQEWVINWLFSFQFNNSAEIALLWFRHGIALSSGLFYSCGGENTNKKICRVSVLFRKQNPVACRAQRSTSSALCEHVKYFTVPPMTGSKPWFLAIHLVQYLKNYITEVAF